MQPSEIIVPIITALGGGFAGAVLQSWAQHKTEVSGKEHELKRTRYECIVILMLTLLDPKNGMDKTRLRRPDLKTIKDVREEINTERANALLFASDEVLIALSAFIDSNNPTYDAFTEVVNYMRKDLWGKKSKIAKEIAVALTPTQLA